MKNRRIMPDAIVRRASTSGDACRLWLEQLDDAIDSLEARWLIRVGDALNGGTHAFVAPATREDGSSCILKLDMPEAADSGAFENEIRFLRLADGRGYVRMYEADVSMRACLLERLGESLADLNPPVNDQIAVLCESLREIWQSDADASSLPDGAASIAWFRGFIPGAWEAHGRPCSREAIDRAMQFLDSREANLNPEGNVLVHGDANAHNILRVPDTDCFKLIDADGLFYERAYDLGVLMREWRVELMENPLARGLARCETLHRLTGEPRQAIWEWGYLQCVATALTAYEILPDDARMLIHIAEEWKRLQTVPANTNDHFTNEVQS